VHSILIAIFPGGPELGGCPPWFSFILKLHILLGRVESFKVSSACGDGYAHWWALLDDDDDDDDDVECLPCVVLHVGRHSCHPANSVRILNGWWRDDRKTESSFSGMAVRLCTELDMTKCRSADQISIGQF